MTLDIVFAGTPPFAAQHLDRLIAGRHRVIAVVTQPDKPGKRGRRLIPAAVKQRATEAGLPVIQPQRLTVADLADYKAQLMVVVAYGQILRQAVLDYPALGCVNVHASLLPAWRGAAPIQRALLAGDTSTGITIIQMDAGLDTGDILAARATDIDPDDTAGSLTARLATLGPPLLMEVLDQLDTGTARARPQAPEQVQKTAGKLNKGEALIDWTGSPRMIDRQIRAFNPRPVAHAYLGKMRVKIYRASVQPLDHDKPPGEVLAVTPEGVSVALTTGQLLIREIRLPLGRGAILSGRDILNARTNIIYPGARFSISPRPTTTRRDTATSNRLD